MGAFLIRINDPSAPLSTKTYLGVCPIAGFGISLPFSTRETAQAVADALAKEPLGAGTTFTVEEL